MGTYWLVKKDTAQEIIEHFSDLWVVLYILLMLLNKLILPVGQVGKNFVIEVHFTKVH
jgi:hypothetical protein